MHLLENAKVTETTINFYTHNKNELIFCGLILFFSSQANDKIE